MKKNLKENMIDFLQMLNKLTNKKRKQINQIKKMAS